MFRLIKIIFNSLILVLAIIGFNAIGGQKYVEIVKTKIVNYVHQKAENNAKAMGNFSNLHEEFQIDNTVNLLGYNAVIAEHKVSGQKMGIINSSKKPILTKADITSPELEKKLKTAIGKLKYQAISFQEIKIISKGTISVYDQTVPYAKFKAKANKLPFSDVTGIVACVTTKDNSEKLIISLNEDKKYSQLIAEEFFKNVKEN